MTKNIRVAWADLQPGDKVHAKGSGNVYPFDSWCSGLEEHSNVIKSVAHKYARLYIPGIDEYEEIEESAFDYATRPAPKKPKLFEPNLCGEYWVRTARKWQKLILLGTFVKGKCWTINGYIAFSWDDFVSRRHPTEILTAEEYYTRKIKGEL